MIHSRNLLAVIARAFFPIPLEACEDTCAKVKHRNRLLPSLLATPQAGAAFDSLIYECLLDKDPEETRKRKRLGLFVLPFVYRSLLIARIVLFLSEAEASVKTDRQTSGG
uniref:Putative secreted protein n=1 Tax=Anopheles darlingi TaxID=43151 RepID=A0A2M4DD22_ANODA